MDVGDVNRSLNVLKPLRGSETFIKASSVLPLSISIRKLALLSRARVISVGRC